MGRNEVEELAKKFHDIYQLEAKRQSDLGIDKVRHPDNYDDLPERTKEYDRVLARYVLSEISSLKEKLAEAGKIQDHHLKLLSELNGECAALKEMVTNRNRLMSCPNCERLREALKEIRAMISCQFTADGKTQGIHANYMRTLISITDDALALPSEETCEHDSGDRWSPQNGTHYSKHPLKEFIPECPSCAPVKKEPEEIAKNLVQEYYDAPATMGPNNLLKDLIIKAIRSERSTSPKEFGREEAIEQARLSLVELTSFCGHEAFDRAVKRGKDALEALEKRRKVNE